MKKCSSIFVALALLALAIAMGSRRNEKEEPNELAEAIDSSLKVGGPPAPQSPTLAVARQTPPAPLYELPEKRAVDWREVAKKITLLDPDQFPEAPPELRQALKKLGCRIPQTLFTYAGYFDTPREVQENLVPGHFKSTSELHWAVLCSRSEQTSLLVFDSLGQNMETLAGPKEDTHLLTSLDGYENADFAWSISATDPDGVIEDFVRLGIEGPRPPPILHEALGSGADEPSVTYYFWYECKWIEVVIGC